MYAESAVVNPEFADQIGAVTAIIVQRYSTAISGYQLVVCRRAVPRRHVATMPCDSSEVLDESVAVAVTTSPAETAEANATFVNVALPLASLVTLVEPR